MNLFIIFLTVLAIGCAIWSILCICICLYQSTVYEKSVTEAFRCNGRSQADVANRKMVYYSCNFCCMAYHDFYQLTSKQKNETRYYC